MATYNAEWLITQQIDSILQQKQPIGVCFCCSCNDWIPADFFSAIFSILKVLPGKSFRVKLSLFNIEQ